MASGDMFANSEEITKDVSEDTTDEAPAQIAEDSEDMEVDKGGETGVDSNDTSEKKDAGEPVNSEVVNEEDDVVSDDPANESNLAEEPNDDSEVVDDPDQEELQDSESVLADKTNMPSATKSTPSKDSDPKLFRFPHGRIKQIMKLDPEVQMVNAEAIFVVNKAVEEFIQCLAVESYHHTINSKKKTIMKDHVKIAIETTDELAFLDGAMED
eukprot:GFUD01034481.1.p1 GENE.GFUD01034481.1~~GFUD01034481.1.p1  ORF type:complete len:212 (+),score=74.03 GFUD01034481.1:57-692(+)